jgi:hypothetical protein
MGRGDRIPATKVEHRADEIEQRKNIVTEVRREQNRRAQRAFRGSLSLS